MSRQSEECDFVLDFDDFVGLSIVVCSSAINNTKNRWITSDFNELWGGIIN